MSTFQIFPTAGNPRFNTFCHRTLLLVFQPKNKKKDFVCECKLLLFPQVCLLYFPRQQQNHPFTHLRHAISHSPSSCCHPPKAFPIHSRQHTLSNCSGQCSRPDIQTGKSAEIIPIKWDWMMENKARGDMKGGSESGLLKSASHFGLFWFLWLKMDSWSRAQIHRLILILSQPRINPLELFLA